MEPGTISVAPDVVFTRFEADGDGVLLNLQTKEYFQLNETAAFIWSKLEEGQNLESIAELMMETYHVGPDQARASIHDLVSELKKEGLVQIS